MTRIAAGNTAGRVRPWLLPVAVVLLALSALWAAGGLRTVEATQGRRAEPGSQLELSRWLLTVHRLELVDTDPSDQETTPAVRLLVRATFTGERSTYGMGTDMITVQGLDGPVGIEDAPSTDGERHGDFDPDVPQEVALVFRWPGAPATAPSMLRVLVRDESEEDNFLFGSEWSIEKTAAVHLDLPCPDQRPRR